MAQVKPLIAEAAELARLDGPLVTLGVRHHSPACARQLLALVEQIRPSLVLIEGPHDFNPQIELLFSKSIRTPVALFTFIAYPHDHALPQVVEGEEAAPLPPGGLHSRHRYWAWYPYCDYSPELVALRWCNTHKVPVRFCDLSFHGKLHVERTERQRRLSATGNRDLSESVAEHAAFIDALCERIRVRDIDELWDHLFEAAQAEAERPLERFARDAATFGLTLREHHDPEDLARQGDLAREAFMASRVRAALDARSDAEGPVLLVCGAMHLRGIRAALRDATPPPEIPPIPEGAHHGIHLSDYDFKRMARLRYAAGMPAPEWYQQLWERGTQDVSSYLLTRVSRELRRRDFPVSTAELLAALEMSERLARFRGRVAPTRSDALDAVRSCWVKGADSTAHGNLLLVTEGLFCGDRAGQVGRIAGDPPLIQDVEDRLDAHRLEAPSGPRELRLRPHRGERDRARAQVLRQLGYLEVPYATQLKGPNLLTGTDLDRVEMLWKLERSPDFRARLLELSALGPTLHEAASQRLRERLEDTERTALAAVQRLTEACVLGLGDLLHPLLAELGHQIGEDARLTSVLKALHKLVLLYRYSGGAEVLEQVELVPYIRACWRRGVVLLDDLARLDEASEIEGIRGLRVLAHASLTLDGVEDLDPALFYEILERNLPDFLAIPGIHGAAEGLLWSVGRRSGEDLCRALHNHFQEIPIDGDIPGRFVTGLMAVGRRAWLEHHELLEVASASLLDLEEDAFRIALPRLRRAHTVLTPAETLMLARALTRLFGIQPRELRSFALSDPEVSAAAVSAGLQTRSLLETWGFSLEVEDLASGETPQRSVALGEVALEEETPARLELEPEARERLRLRWRLVLGRHASPELSPDGLMGEAGSMDEVLGFLYDREYEDEAREQRGNGGRYGGRGASTLSVPDWIHGIERLFPKSTVERLEADALHRYGLHELVTNPEVLERCEPSMALLEAIMQVKGMMSPAVLEAARRIVREVAAQLREQLMTEVRIAFSGRPRLGRLTTRKVARNFDARATLRRNLKNWDPESQQLVIERPWFRESARRHMNWDVVLCVDQSGSMLTSMIHAGVLASIFWEVRELSPRLVIFDTNVVDLTEHCRDPVETLMSVQLGGGTDIAKAVGYCETLMERPDRTIFVLVTDLYEGGDPKHLIGTLQRLIESGVRVLILAALDEAAEPIYDRRLGATLVAMGAEVGAMTPDKLVSWVSEVVR